MDNEPKLNHAAGWLDVGQELSRVLALSDGVFGFALTLLAIDLTLPEIAANAVSEELPRAILGLAPKFLVFALAFYLVIQKWMVHRRIFEHITRYDSNLIWLNNLLLLFIAFMPVPTGVLGQYPTQPAALIFFGVTQIVTTIVQWSLWAYATHKRRFVDEAFTQEVITFFNNRYVAQVVSLAAFTIIAVFNVWFALLILISIAVGFEIYVSYQRNRRAEMS